MTQHFGLALRQREVRGPRPRRADAELRIDPPGRRVSGVVGVIEQRDVREVVSAVDAHPDVDPHRALSLGARVALPRGVDDFGRHPCTPRHTQEEPAVVVAADRDIGLRVTSPLQVDHEPAVRLAHRPARRFGEDDRTRRVEEVVHRLPAHFVLGARASASSDAERRAPPVVALRVVEVVAPVDARQAPEEARLVRMMGRPIFGQYAPAVWRRDRMQIRPRVGPCLLSQHRLPIAWPIDGNRACAIVLPDRQPARLRRLPLLRLEPAGRRADRHDRERQTGRQGEVELRGHGVGQVVTNSTPFCQANHAA